MLTYIGLDFSMNKPAMTIEQNNKIEFFFWPLSIDKKSELLYLENDVKIFNRNLEPVSEKDSTKLTQIHIKRAIDLSGKICEDIKPYLKDIDPVKVFVATEGLSFGSTGNSVLDLATYKGIFLSKLVSELNIWNFYTYAPITIKSTAGCAKKNSNKKEDMINAFINESINTKLNSTLVNNPSSLKKKINYIDGIDDIVDSYFCFKTLKNKLSL